MWLSALYIWGCLLAFAACDSCPESENAASWVRLKPLGNCDDEENVCPYRITLPPLSIQLPKPFRELEKMAKELQNLKEVVNRLRRDCQECKERQRVERGGTRDQVEDEGRRPQSVKQNISSPERQSHNGEQMVRIVISTPPQGDTEEMNHSSLGRQRWSNDRRSDADQITVDQSSETSREVKIFDPSLEETPKDIYEVKQALSPSTEETDRQRKIQLDELIKSSVPRRKDTVESVTHGSEMSREVNVLNPSLGETPEDISEVKQVFTPTTEERERTFQEAELLESPIPRTKDFVQSPTHRKQQPNMFRERNAKNISGILAVKRRAQNMTDTNRLGSNSGDANTKTMDLSISAGNRRIVNFSRAGGPLRPKTYINSKTKASEENRLRNPAAVRMHLQGGERTVKTGPKGSGFSPVRSGVMRIKETSHHIANSNPVTNSGLIISTHDEKITTINPKPGTNIGIIASNEDEKIAIRNPNLGTNSILTPLTDQKITIINPKDGTNSGLNSLTVDENIAIVNPNPGTNSRLTPSTDEKITTRVKPGTNSGLTTSTEDENIAKVYPKPGINSRLTSSTGDGKMMTKPKPGTNSGLTTTTEDENMAKINPSTGIKIEQISTEDERMTITSPQPVTTSRTDEKMIILNPNLGSNSGLNQSIEDKNIAIVNPKPGTNSHLTPSTDEKMTTNTKPDTNSRFTTSHDDEEIAIINPNHGTKIGQIISTEDEKLTATTSKSGTSISQTPSTNEKMTITNPKLGTNIRLTPSTVDGKLTNPKPGTNTRLTPSTDDGKKTITNPKPGINSRPTLSTNDEKMTTTKPATNSGLTTSIEDENMGIINPNPGNKTGQIISTEDGKLTVKSSKPGTNLSLTPSTNEKTSITNPKLGTNSRLSSSTEEGKSTTTNPKPITNSVLTPSTGGKRITTTNPKPGTDSRLTPSTHVEKVANEENTSRESDLRIESENDLKDTRQVTVDGEENFRKLNKTVITRVPTNLRTENSVSVSHTVQTTNKSMFSVMNGVEQPNLIKVENEYMGVNASLVTSSTADIGPSAGEEDSTFPGRRVDEENYLTPITGTKTKSDQGDPGSTVLDGFNERETYRLTSDETQMGTFKEEANEKKTPGSVKKDLLHNRKVSQLESDLVNPTLVPSVKITSADPKISSATKTGQGTRILKPGSISLREDVGNIQPTNSKTNISKMREGSNVRFVKNITRVMPKLPIRPGRHPTTGNPAGGPKLHMINKMPGNSSVVLPSNSSISGRNVNFGRRNSSVMMKPSYVRSRPRFQTEPNKSIGFKTNVSTVTHFITATGEISTDRTKEIKPETQAMGLHVSYKNTSTMSKSRNADEVQDHVEGHSSETVSTSKVVSGTEVSNNENSLHTGASDSLSGGKESKQFGLETTGQHPSTQQKELSGVNVKSQPATSSNPRVSFTVMDHEERTKHIPPVTIKHEDMVKNISQDTASTPISFENTVATRELELIELNEDKVPKYSGDVLSNPNSVSDVRGNNGERYTIPVVLETLANVEEIKGSKVFSLSPEDTADGFKTIAVRDEVTQKERAENKIQSTCEGDCITTPTQQPTTQGRPAFESERGRGLPQDCADYISKSRKNGVYRVTPRSKNTTFFVPCDMETSGGGWTLIQQRFNGSISFNRTWDEYKRGFGKLMGEFWLGNDKIYWLTQARNMSLRIELEDFEGVREYAHYDHFQVANESQQYRLSIGGYSGTAGNAMQFNKNYNHDQKLFTTPDRDNDLYPSGNCGAYYSSGWWFDACMSANLNGIYYHTKYKGVRNGIFWGTWHNITMEYYPTNVRQSFKTVRMMIRPRSYAN